MSDDQHPISGSSEDDGVSGELDFIPDPSKHIATSDPRCKEMLEAGRALRGFPNISAEVVLAALNEIPEWIKGRDVIEGFGLKPEALSHCMIAGLRPFSNKNIGQEVCHPWGKDDRMREESRLYLTRLEHRDMNVAPPQVFKPYGHKVIYSVPEWMCLTLHNPDNTDESTEDLIQKHVELLFRTVDVLKFQREYGLPTCSEKLKRCWRNIVSHIRKERSGRVKCADGSWVSLETCDSPTLMGEIKKITAQARFNGYIDQHHLALVLATEEGNIKILPTLLESFLYETSRGNETIGQRIEAWYELLDLWVGTGVYYFFDEKRPGPCAFLLDPYRYSKLTGRFELIERVRDFCPPELDFIYVKLEDIYKYFQRIMDAYGIYIDFPIEKKKDVLITECIQANKDQSLVQSVVQTSNFNNVNDSYLTANNVNDYIFKTQGNSWVIAYEGFQLTLESKNLKYIHCLISIYMENQRPKEISCIDLENAVEGHASGEVGSDWQCKMSKDEWDKYEGLNLSESESSIPILTVDDRKWLISQKLALEKELEEAKKTNDRGRIEKYERELEEFREWILKEYGPKLDKKEYKDTEFASRLEAARKRISVKIHRCLNEIKNHNKQLYDHLKSGLTPITAFPAYKPDKHINWKI